MDDTDVMDISEVAKMLRLPKSSIYRMTAKHQIPHKRIGRLLRFSRARLNEWWAKRPEIPLADEPAPATPDRRAGSSLDEFPDSQTNAAPAGRENTHGTAENGKRPRAF